MAINTKDSNESVEISTLESFLPAEIILHILDCYLLEQSFSSENIFDYFLSIQKNIKIIRGINKHFKAFTKELIKRAKRIGKERFVKEVGECDMPFLEAKLREVFKKARNNKKLNEPEKINEDELASEAAALIIVGADHKNITVECDGPSWHGIKVPILEFIARTNMLVKLIPILVIYKAAVNNKDVINNTPLYYAVSYGNNEAVQALCSWGSDIGIKYDLGNTVFLFLLESLINSQEQIGMCDKYIKTMHILLKYGDITLKDLTIENDKGKTFLELLDDYAGDDMQLKLLRCVAELQGELDDLHETDLENHKFLPLISEFVKKFMKNLQC